MEKNEHEAEKDIIPDAIVDIAIERVQRTSGCFANSSGSAFNGNSDAWIPWHFNQ
jgi:c-di-GMP-related signal transduction protein